MVSDFRNRLFIKNEKGDIRKAEVVDVNLVFFTFIYNKARYTVSWEDLIKTPVEISGYSILENEFRDDIGFKLSESIAIGRSVVNVDDTEITGI